MPAAETWYLVRVLLYGLPPALAILIASPLLISPFVNEGIDRSYIVFALPLYLGVMAAPAYIYALLGDLRAGDMPRVIRTWVRLSLALAVLASLWATVVLGGAWRELLPFVMLLVSSTVTSIVLLWRFECRGRKIAQAVGSNKS